MAQGSLAASFSLAQDSASSRLSVTLLTHPWRCLLYTSFLQLLLKGHNFLFRRRTRLYRKGRQNRAHAPLVQRMLFCGNLRCKDVYKRQLQGRMQQARRLGLPFGPIAGNSPGTSVSAALRQAASMPRSDRRKSSSRDRSQPLGADFGTGGRHTSQYSFGTADQPGPALRGRCGKRFFHDAHRPNGYGLRAGYSLSLIHI